MFLPFCADLLVGGIGITAAHELSHKASRLEQTLGRLLVVSVSYGHFYVEHVMGHHKAVGLTEDPATSRFKENFYLSFLPRVLKGEFISACKLERERLKNKGLPWHANEM